MNAPRMLLRLSILLGFAAMGSAQQAQKDAPPLPPGFEIVGVNTVDYPHGYATDVSGDGRYTYVANGESTSGKSFWIVDVSDPLKPRKVAVRGSGFCPQMVRTQGNLIFVPPSGGQSVYIWDATDKTNPQFMSIIGDGGMVRAAAAAGSMLYVNYQGSGDSTRGGNAGAMKVFDVSDPKKPARLGAVDVPLPGYISGILAGPPGVVYLTNGKLLFVVDVRDPGNPKLASETPVENGAGISLCIQGDRLFVATSAGFAVFNIKDPGKPQFVAQYVSPNIPKGGNACKISVAADKAVLTTVFGPRVEGHLSSVEVIDVSVPAVPRLLGASKPQNGQFNGCWYSGGRYAYITDMNLGQWTVDIADPVNPKLVASLGTAGEGNDVCPHGKYVYEADYPGNLFAWDITDKANPKFLPYRYFTNCNGAKEILMSGDYLFFGQPGPLLIFDTKADPANPKLVASVKMNGQSGMALDGNLLYVTCFGGGGSTDLNYFHILDVSNPAQPRILVSLSSKTSKVPGYMPTSPVIKGGYCYYTAPEFKKATAQLVAINVKDPSHPAVSRIDPIPTWACACDGPGTTIFLRTPAGIDTYDVSDPAVPKLVKTFKQSLGRDVYRIERHGKYLYTAIYGGGCVAVFDCSAPLDLKYVGIVGVGGHNYKVCVADGLCYHPLLGGLGITKVPWSVE